MVRHGPAAFHEGADRRGGGVEDRYLVLLDHLPEGAWLGGPGRALVHQGGGAIGEGTVDDVAVAGDPAHIRRAPVDVVVADIEDPLEGEVGPEVVAGGGVHHPLGFAGGAGGIEHKQPVFASHRFGRTLAALGLDQLMPPVVPPRLDHGPLVGALHHQHVLHAGAGATGEGLIHGGLERHGLVLAEATIGGDHQLHLAIDQAIPQGIGGETTKHHRVGGTDAGAGQHGNGGLRHHGHIKGHQIPLANPQGLEGIGRLADLAVELAVGKTAGVAGFALPDQGRFLGRGAGQVAIKAVVGEVGAAALKPAGEGGIGPIKHRVKGLEPVQVLAG